jgi:GNAT superfamily N-acetyltransferase
MRVPLFHHTKTTIMLTTGTVTTNDELLQIHRLNQQNLKQNVTVEEQNKEGFVSWLYAVDLLKKMHELAPSVIVKDGEKLIAYALTTLKEASVFHSDLAVMFRNLEKVEYKGRPLFSYRFYCMGQICIDKNYRGKGLVNALYQKHREIYRNDYDFLLTEISSRNTRSVKAHEKTGFETIYTYSDAMDEWKVVVWDWK